MSTLNQALKYAGLGWEVFPLHSIIDGKCTCSKESCHSPGKHPKTKNGFKDASNDSEQIKKMFQKTECNIGIRTGLSSGFWVLDIDKKNEGLELWHSLEKKNGQVNTLCVKTGGGGLHFYFANPQGTEIPCKANIRPGIDIRGDGGYVVAPTSDHISGGRYAFSNQATDLLSQIQPAPDWILELIAVKPTEAQVPQRFDRQILEGQRNDRLFKMGIGMRRIGFNEDAIDSALQKHNTSNCTPSLPTNEISSIVTSVSKHPPGVQKQVYPTPVLDERALIGPIGQILKKLEPDTEASVPSMLAQFLTIFGNIIGNKAHKMVSAQKHTACLFVLLVGKTSCARKGQSLSIVHFLINEIIPDLKSRRVSGLSSSEGLIEALLNIGSKQKSTPCLWAEQTEFALVLNQGLRSGNTLSETLRLAWDSDPLCVLRRIDPVEVESYHFSLIGHITQTELDIRLSVNDTYNGLGNRILFVHAERKNIIANPKTLKAEDFKQEIDELKENLLLAQNADEMEFTEQAAKRWEEIYHECSTGRSGKSEPLKARCEPYILRVSLIYALICGSPQIGLEHLEAGYAFVRYCMDSLSYLYDGKLSAREQKLYDALLKSSSGLSRTDVSNVFNRHVKSDELTQLLDGMVELGLATIKDDPAGKSRYYAN